MEECEVAEKYRTETDVSVFAQRSKISEPLEGLAKHLPFDVFSGPEDVVNFGH